MMYEELKKEIQFICMNIDNSFIYYPLKAYGVKYLNNKTIRLVKICYILHKLGFKLTKSLVSDIIDRYPTSIGTSLSKLGDKRILFLIGYDSKTIRNTPVMVYTFDNTFIEKLNIPSDKIEALKTRIIKEGVKT